MDCVPLVHTHSEHIYRGKREEGGGREGGRNIGKRERGEKEGEGR